MWCNPLSAGSATIFRHGCRGRGLASPHGTAGATSGGGASDCNRRRTRIELDEIGFVENNEMVQTFGSHRSHLSLSDGIGSGRPERRTNLSYSEAPHATIEVRAIAAVAIVNQESPERLLLRSCFTVADPKSVSVVTPALDCGGDSLPLESPVNGCDCMP